MYLTVTSQTPLQFAGFKPQEKPTAKKPKGNRFPVFTKGGSQYKEARFQRIADRHIKWIAAQLKKWQAIPTSTAPANLYKNWCYLVEGTIGNNKHLGHMVYVGKTLLGLVITKHKPFEQEILLLDVRPDCTYATKEKRKAKGIGQGLFLMLLKMANRKKQTVTVSSTAGGKGFYDRILGVNNYGQYTYVILPEQLPSLIEKLKKELEAKKAQATESPLRRTNRKDRPA